MGKIGIRQMFYLEQINCSPLYTLQFNTVLTKRHGLCFNHGCTLVTLLWWCALPIKDSIQSPQMTVLRTQ